MGTFVGRAITLVGVCAFALLSTSIVEGVVKLKPVDPSLPYDEGNRPQVYLNGLWDFMPLPNGTSRDIPDTPPTVFKSEEVKIPVPGWWDDYGEFDLPLKWGDAWNAWYRRAFTVPRDWRGKRLKLHFGAVTQYAKVFVNGKYVGESIHGIAPFTLDVTKTARIGENRLEVFVQGYIHALAEGIKVRDAHVDRGHRNWGVAEFEFEKGGSHREREVRDISIGRRGICRDVVLEAVPPVYVGDVTIVTSFRQSTLDVEVRVVNTHSKGYPLTVELAVAAADGIPVVKLRQSVTVGAGRMKKVHFEYLWNRPRLWNQWDPHLYACTVTVRPTAERWFDQKRVRFGFREVWIGPRHDILLNGLPLRMMGTNLFDAWATTPTPSYTRELFRQIRIMGLNSVRTIDGMPRWFYDIADEMGMLVMDQFLHWLEWDYQNEEQKRNVRECYKRLLEARRNHPSIVIWSLSNEQCKRALHMYHGADPPSAEWADAEGPYMKGLQDFVSSIDPTRILTHCGGHDFNGVAPTYNWHYCSPRGTFLNWSEEFKKPFLIGEWEFGWQRKTRSPEDIRRLTDLGIRIARAAEISGAWLHPVLKWCMWGSYGEEWKWKHDDQSTIDLEWETMEGPFIKPAHPWRPHVNPWNPDKPKIKRGHLYEVVKSACAPNMVFIDIVDTIMGRPGDFPVSLVNDYLHEVKLHLTVFAEVEGKKTRLTAQRVTLGPMEVKHIRVKYPEVDRSVDQELVVTAELRKDGSKGEVVNTHKVRAMVRKLEEEIKVDLSARWRQADAMEGNGVRGPFVVLDISRVCNRGFSDPVPGDGEGGWTQQGPQNDLHGLLTGDRNFSGIPFVIANEADNRNRSMVFMKSARYADMPMRVGPIRVMRRVTAIHFLHVAAWSVKDQKAGKYVIQYRDGSKVQFPVVGGRTIDDWWSPKDLTGALVAWRGTNNKGIYLATWRNPSPEKPVDALFVQSKNSGTAWGLIAATVVPVHLAVVPPESLQVDDFSGARSTDWEEVPSLNQGLVGVNLSDGVGTLSFTERLNWGRAGVSIPVNGAYWANQGAKAIALRIRNPETQEVLNARRNKKNQVDQGIVDKVVLRLCEGEERVCFERRVNVSNAQWEEHNLSHAEFSNVADPSLTLDFEHLKRVRYLEILVRGVDTWTWKGWYPFKIQIDWIEARR